MRKTTATALSTCALLAASPAVAGGISTARFGGELGHPTTDNPTAIYYNPAAIGASEGINIFADGNLAYRIASYQHFRAPTDAPEPADGVGANTGTGKLENFVAAPMLGATAALPLTDSLGLGLGAALFVPFGGSAVWSKNDAFADHPAYAGAVDGPQRWYNIHGTIRSIYISGAASLSIDHMVHLGVSGGASIEQVDTLIARNANGSDDLTFEGRALLQASRVHGQLGGGVLLTPLDDIDQLRIGLSYQAPPGISGAKAKGTLARFLGGNPSDDDIEIDDQMPDVFRAGVSYRPIKRVELRLFGDYTRWSLFQNECIETAGEPCKVDDNGAPADGTSPILNMPRHWNDSVNVRAGMSYWVGPRIELMTGLGYESKAVPDEFLEVGLMDFDGVSAALGGRFQLTDWLAGALTYTHFFFFPRDTIGKSRNATLHSISKGPDAGGIYKQTIGLVNINLQASFDPWAKPSEDESARR